MSYILCLRKTLLLEYKVINLYIRERVEGWVVINKSP